jgi:hypothetical protein
LLRSEINELEKTVGALLNNAPIDNQSSYLKQITGWVARVQELCADLKKKWTRELLSNTKEQIVKRYIQYHQAGIIQLSDGVSTRSSHTNFTTGSDALHVAYHKIIMELEGMLQFLSSQFYQYFDSDHTASKYYRRQLDLKVSEIEPLILNINQPLIDKALRIVVINSVKEVTADGIIGGISYREADQVYNLINMIYQLIVNGKNVTTERLIASLYLQNFNSLHFLNWYKEHILNQLSELIGDDNRDKFIDHQINGFSGVYVNAEKAIQVELPAIDRSIIPWLQEQTSTQTLIPIVNSPSFQFPLNLSVPQFALFIRVFYKTGCFPIDNVALITRFFTEHFTTKKQPHISQKSFGRAFYNLDQSAAAVVRDFLQKMLNYLNKTYFP